MPKSSKNKSQSPLVQTVLALDSHFSELERLGAQINGIDMDSDFNLQRAQQLMNRFAECGEAVSKEVLNLSTYLNAARVRTEAVAQAVSVRAAQMQERKNEQQKKLEEFRLLGEKVRGISAALSELSQPSEKPISADDRAHLAMRLAEFELQLHPLIEQAQSLKKDAQSSKMKTLEQNADSLSQSLQMASKKLGAFT